MITRIQSQNFSDGRVVKFQKIDKVYNYATHIHQFAELVWCFEGDLNITVEGKTETLHPGEGAFVFPFQPHSVRSKEKNKLALVVFSPSVIPDFFGATAGKVGKSITFTPSESTKIMLDEHIFKKDDFELLSVKGCIYLALSDYLASTELYLSSINTSISASVVGYINEHITENITLANIAKELGYNPNYLSSRIHEIFGLNLCSLIASIRADKAKIMLWETNKTGLEICYECGFGSERSFHRQFKAITGSTPKEYRAFVQVGAVDRGKVKYF